jgi:hypothetical protein
MISRFPIIENGVGVWVEKLSMGTDNGTHFPIVGQRFVDRGHVRSGKVGNADARFFSTRALGDFAAAYVRDVLTSSPILLADDFTRFRAEHAEELYLIPPQCRIEAIGRYTETPPIPPSENTRSSYPKISVICPVFKPDFLTQVIHSVRAQTWQNWELCMLVDGPPEEARQKIIAGEIKVTDAMLK